MELGVELKSVGGGRLRGFCPFHTETEPSFTVFPDGSYKCFGCQTYGSFDKIQKEFGCESNIRPLFKIDISNTRDKSDYLIAKLLNKLESSLSTKLKGESFKTKAKVYDAFDRMKIGIRFAASDNILDLVVAIKGKFTKIIESI